MQGWFKIYRQIEDWEWYKSPNTRHLFEHLIGRANVEPKRFKGTLLHRGELITSVGHLSDQTGLSMNQVRLALRNLESTGEIICQRTNRWTKVKVTNFNKYQNVKCDSSTDFNNAKNIQNTNTSQTDDSRSTLSKEDKEVKNSKNLITQEKWTKVKVTNFNKYQNVKCDSSTDFNNAKNIQNTNTSQTDDSRSTLNKEDKEVKNSKNLITQEKQQQLLLYEQYFSDFWNSYRPISVNGEFVAKGSKKLAKEKFFKILRKGENYENIKRGLIKYLNYCQTNSIKSCGCCVFLNQQRWLDDYSTGRTVQAITGAKQQATHSKIGAIAEVVNYYRGSTEVY